MVNCLLSDTTTWYPVLFDTPENIFRSIAIWLTLALIIAFVVCTLLIKGDGKKRFFKSSLIIAVIYACAIGVGSLAFWLNDASQSGEFLVILFVPIAVFLLSVAVSAVLIGMVKNKTARVVSLIFTGASLVACIVCSAVHFSSGASLEMNGLNKEDVNTIGLIFGAVLLTCIVVVVAKLCDKRTFSFDTRSISYASVCIAMSFALSYLRLVKMPQGGSITVASLLPLMIYSYMFGAKKGVFAGVVYGMLQAIQDPYIVHPAQFILDYPVAFSCIGLSGVFANVKGLEKVPQIKFALGAVVAGLARFIMHFLSGAFAFASFAGDQNPFLYSFLYQAGYVLPDIAIVIAIGIVVFSSASFRRFIGEKSIAE